MEVLSIVKNWKFFGATPTSTVTPTIYTCMSMLNSDRGVVYHCK